MEVRVEEEVRTGNELRDNIIHSSAQRCQNVSVDWKDDKAQLFAPVCTMCFKRVSRRGIKHEVSLLTFIHSSTGSTANTEAADSWSDLHWLSGFGGTCQRVGRIRWTGSSWSWCVASSKMGTYEDVSDSDRGTMVTQDDWVGATTVISVCRAESPPDAVTAVTYSLLTYLVELPLLLMFCSLRSHYLLHFLCPAGSKPTLVA